MHHRSPEKGQKLDHGEKAAMPLVHNTYKSGNYYFTRAKGRSYTLRPLCTLHVKITMSALVSLFCCFDIALFCFLRVVRYFCSFFARVFIMRPRVILFGAAASFLALVLA